MSTDYVDTSAGLRSAFEELRTQTDDMDVLIESLKTDYSNSPHHLLERITQLRCSIRQHIFTGLKFVENASKHENEDKTAHTRQFISHTGTKHLISKFLNHVRSFYDSETALRNFLEWDKSHRTEVYGEQTSSVLSNLLHVDNRLEETLERHQDVIDINNSIEELSLLMATLSNLVVQQDFQPLVHLSDMMVTNARLASAETRRNFQREYVCCRVFKTSRKCLLFILVLIWLVAIGWLLGKVAKYGKYAAL
ncbi:hypothetical protein P9112_005996 [Eukaryota sp. TZLM1-RC]